MLNLRRAVDKVASAFALKVVVSFKDGNDDPYSVVNIREAAEILSIVYGINIDAIYTELAHTVEFLVNKELADGL